MDINRYFSPTAASESIRMVQDVMRIFTTDVLNRLENLEYREIEFAYLEKSRLFFFHFVANISAKQLDFDAIRAEIKDEAWNQLAKYVCNLVKRGGLEHFSLSDDYDPKLLEYLLRNVPSFTVDEKEAINNYLLNKKGNPYLFILNENYSAITWILRYGYEQTFEEGEATNEDRKNYIENIETCFKVAKPIVPQIINVYKTLKLVHPNISELHTMVKAYSKVNTIDSLVLITISVFEVYFLTYDNDSDKNFNELVKDCLNVAGQKIAMIFFLNTNIEKGGSPYVQEFCEWMQDYYEKLGEPTPIDLSLVTRYQPKSVDSQAEITLESDSNEEKSPKQLTWGGNRPKNDWTEEQIAIFCKVFASHCDRSPEVIRYFFWGPTKFESFHLDKIKWKDKENLFTAFVRFLYNGHNAPKKRIEVVFDIDTNMDYKNKVQEVEAQLANAGWDFSNKRG